MRRHTNGPAVVIDLENGKSADSKEAKAKATDKTIIEKSKDPKTGTTPTPAKAKASGTDKVGKTIGNVAQKKKQGIKPDVVDDDLKSSASTKTIDMTTASNTSNGTTKSKEQSDKTAKKGENAENDAKNANTKAVAGKSGHKNSHTPGGEGADGKTSNDKIVKPKQTKMEKETAEKAQKLINATNEASRQAQTQDEDVRRETAKPEAQKLIDLEKHVGLTPTPGSHRESPYREPTPAQTPQTEHTFKFESEVSPLNLGPMPSSINFELTITSFEEHGAKHFVLPSLCKINDFLGKALLASEGGERMAIASSKECAIIIPGGARVVVQIPTKAGVETAEFRAMANMWSCAMNMAAAAVGKDMIFAGKTVKVHLF